MSPLRSTPTIASVAASTIARRVAASSSAASRAVTSRTVPTIPITAPSPSRMGETETSAEKREPSPRTRRASTAAGHALAGRQAVDPAARELAIDRVDQRLDRVAAADLGRADAQQPLRGRVDEPDPQLEVRCDDGVGHAAQHRGRQLMLVMHPSVRHRSEEHRLIHR